MHRGNGSRSRGVILPGFCGRVVPLLEKRAQGKPGAGCTRSPVCKNCARKAHGLNHRYSRDIPAFPAQWVYGLYVLSPVSGVSCHRRRRDIFRGLTPRSRRQDHTTSPYAALLRPKPALIPFGNQAVTPEIAASIASCAQRIVTIAKRPSCGRGMTGFIPQIRIPVKRNIFECGT